ncbi:MAG: hypothetical protein JO047_10165 [Alphaproteobacteria bacterium]|nr:hypothetical protein [Alphaproteobacteria bacterium]
MAGEAEGFMHRIIERGRAGDMAAIMFVLDRVHPRPRDRSITFELPPIETPQDVRTAMQAVLVAMTSGELTPKEAADVMKVIEAAGRVLEVVAAAEERLARVELALATMTAKTGVANHDTAPAKASQRSAPAAASHGLAKTSEIQGPPPGHPPASGSPLVRTPNASYATLPG